MRRPGTKIVAEQTSGEDPMVFSVTVSDSAGSTRHRVTLTQAAFASLSQGKVSPSQCVESAFEFLLERESKTDLLTSFDVNVIRLSYPNFEREFANYLPE